MNFDYRGLAAQLERVHSPRLALRPLALSDGWPLYRATRNPDFNRHLMWTQPADEPVLMERVDVIIEASRRGQLAAMSAVLKDTGEWVALFRFQPHASGAEVIEMGLWTNDRFWHDGYSVELTRACIDATFSLSAARAMVGAAAPANLASSRVLERCGLVPSQQVYRQGELETEVPLQEYIVSRAHWMSGGNAPGFAAVPRFVPVLLPVPAAPANLVLQTG